MKTKEIRDLIEFISKTGLNEVNIETEELKLSVKRDAEIKTQLIESVPAVATTVASGMIPSNDAKEVALPTPVPTSSDEESLADSGKYKEVKSPMIGTFYRAANPESDPFINVGDTISEGQTVCIVEAMKLFNEIESDLSGTVVKILVENSTPVEYDQPLFLVEPF